MKDIYQFVPAAVFPKLCGCTGIYIKHHRNKDINPHIKQYTSKSIWIDTPDRELIICQDTGLNDNLRPLNEGFDEFISVSPCGPSAGDSGLKWGMLNYLQNPNESYDYNYNLYNDTKKSRVKLMSDSGGLQVGRGGMSFIDPKKLALWYHKNCDAGMTLDIPNIGFSDREILFKTAKIQKMNNDKMIKVLEDNNSKTALINILHGLSLKDRTEYQKVVHHSKIDKFAMAGLSRLTIFESTKLLVETMVQPYAKFYNHVHLLGVFNNKVMPIYIWLFKMINQGGHNILMTSDSTTAIQQAISRSSMNYPFFDKPIEIQFFGTVNQNGHTQSRILPSKFRLINCSCYVCSAIKYADILTFVKGAPISQCIVHHNRLAMNSYGEYMNQMSQQLDFSTYVDLVRQQIGKNNKEPIDALVYVQQYLGESSKIADEKFYYYTKAKKDYSYSSSLFTNEEVVDIKDKTATVKKAIEKYNNYHLKGKKYEMKKLAVEKGSVSIGHKSKNTPGVKKKGVRR